MVATIDKELSATVQADGTTMTAGPGNTGFSSFSGGTQTGNTYQHQTAGRMGQANGMRIVQSGANLPFFYLDMTAAWPIAGFRIPYMFAATPAVSNSLLRFYSSATHATNLGTLTHTTANRLNYVDTPSSVNVSTPSGNPLVAATPYIIHLKLDNTANTFDLKVYESGVADEIDELALSGTVSALATDIQSIRFGICAANVNQTIYTNNKFAIGYGDHIERYDYTPPPEAVVPADLMWTGTEWA